MDSDFGRRSQRSRKKSVKLQEAEHTEELLQTIDDPAGGKKAKPKKKSGEFESFSETENLSRLEEVFKRKVLPNSDVEAESLPFYDDDDSIPEVEVDPRDLLMAESDTGLIGSATNVLLNFAEPKVEPEMPVELPPKQKKRKRSSKGVKVASGSEEEDELMIDEDPYPPPKKRSRLQVMMKFGASAIAPKKVEKQEKREVQPTVAPIRIVREMESQELDVIGVHDEKTADSIDASFMATSTPKSATPKPPKKPRLPAGESGKTKRPRALSAYTIWCQSMRGKLTSHSDGSDFSTISRKLGEMWSNLPEKEKMQWKRKAIRQARTGQAGMISTGNKGGAPRGRKPADPNREVYGKSKPSVVEDDGGDSFHHSPMKRPSTECIDAAAHLLLLGESLSNLGYRLNQQSGNIAVQGSLSVLLDAFLAALPPLLCITRQIPELNGCPREVLTNALDNISYIMPGV